MQDEAAPKVMEAMEPAAAPAVVAPRGPRAIDKVRQAFPRAVRWIDVPEWGLRLGFTSLTQADMDAVAARQPIAVGGGREPAPEENEQMARARSLTLLIMKALEEQPDGTLGPAFEFGDVEFLRREAEYTVLSRVLGFMYGRILTGEEARVQIEKTPASASASDSPSPGA